MSHSRGSLREQDVWFAERTTTLIDSLFLCLNRRFAIVAIVTDLQQDVSARRGIDLITALVMVYLAWFLVTPYGSAKLSFLLEMRFEKILAGSLIVLVLLNGKLSNLFRPSAPLLYLLFLVMLVSHLTADSNDTYHGLKWREFYWKKVVFFMIIVAGLRTRQNIRRCFFAITAIVLFYELYSWFDFLRGGSYVYQQGLKRMIGTWSRGGYGAANGFAVLAAFAMPFAVFMYRSTDRTLLRATGGTAYVVAVMSIVYSGTRGAMLIAGLYFMFVFRRLIFRPRLFISALVMFAVAIPTLPETIKHRYTALLFDFTAEDELGTDRLATTSAKARLTGLTDGFKLGQMRPVTGFGPGASPAARQRFLFTAESGEWAQQLHNLYGQIPAEIGFPGFVIWLALFFSSVLALRNMIGDSTDRQTKLMCATLISALLIWAAYGMVSHTLYDVRWIMLFAFTTALRSIDSNHTQPHLESELDSDCDSL